jgi:effector-binding domain-containing protein
METKMMLLTAMREQNPEKFKRLRKTGALERVVDQIGARIRQEVKMAGDLPMEQLRAVQEVAMAAGVEDAVADLDEAPQP